MKKPDYPIKFLSIPKEKIWGGHLLKDVLQKKGATDTTGESWEISAVSNNISIVANGFLKGKTLQQLIETYREKVLGEHVFATFGNQFPLLFKFIDAKEDLSVQLHPDDALAEKRHNAMGKTEMWYVIATEPEATIITGFSKKLNKKSFQTHIKNQTLASVLKREKIAPGDVFYITPGRVHAIGAGVLLAEIQQTSDITYRVFDWNRPGQDGKLRALHNELAIDAIDFENKAECKIPYKTQKNRFSKILKNPYFQTSLLRLEQGEVKRNLAKIDSFVVYMCVSGSATIHVANKQELVNFGETVLIPARVKEIVLQGNDAKLLEVFVPSEANL